MFDASMVPAGMKLVSAKQPSWKVKQPYETDLAWAAFCAFRDLGIERSVAKAYAAFKKLATPPKAAPKHWREWHRQNGWQMRAGEYDAAWMDRRREEREAARTQIEDAELADYHKQLAAWEKAWASTPVHLAEGRIMQTTETLPDGTMVQRFVQFVGLNYGDLANLTRWRDEIAKQGRRALGMPDRIIEQQGTSTLKAMVFLPQVSDFDVPDPSEDAGLLTAPPQLPSGL